MLAILWLFYQGGYMSTVYNEERRYLIRLAVDAYNYQFEANFNYQQFDIFTITANNYSQVGFEVFTLQFEDYLRLRLYCNPSNQDLVLPYRLDADTSNILGLGQKVFVADALISDAFFFEDLNVVRRAFPPLVPDLSLTTVLMMEGAGSDAILLEDGSYIIVDG